MTEEKALLTIKDYLKHYHLNDWKAGLDNAKSRYGCCNYRTKTISVSKHFISDAGEEHIINTIRHEIAHALNWWRDNHGRKWKYVCLVVGARPKRNSPFGLIAKEKYKYKAICPTCGQETFANRLTEGMRNGRIHCRKCYKKVSLVKSRFVFELNK